MTAASRLDLGRPINFNPGPGSYLREAMFTDKSSLLSSYSGEESLLKRKKRERTLLESLPSTNMTKHQ